MKALTWNDVRVTERGHLITVQLTVVSAFECFLSLTLAPILEGHGCDHRG